MIALAFPRQDADTPCIDGTYSVSYMPSVRNCTILPRDVCTLQSPLCPLTISSSTSRVPTDSHYEMANVTSLELQQLFNVAAYGLFSGNQGIGALPSTLVNTSLYGTHDHACHILALSNASQVGVLTLFTCAAGILLLFVNFSVSALRRC